MSMTLEDEGYHRSWISTALRGGSVGGVLMVAAMVLGLVAANTPLAPSYFGLRDTEVGLHGIPGLHHTVGEWASEGLLAVFFFIVGLELKTEFVSGALQDLRKALVPVAAACGGVILPALVYLLVNGLFGSPETMRGWATPTATDIAFAVSVLALVGPALPAAVRTFLLTLAVVDDLIAIVIIAVVYSEGVHLLPLLAAVLPAAAYWVLTHSFPRFFAFRAWASWAILMPLGVVTWLLLYAAGVHATIAGVLLGFMVPVLRRTASREDEADVGLAPRLAHRYAPLSNGVAVPVFAFFASGVAVGGWEGLRHSVADPVALGVVLGLVCGKALGIFGTVFLVDRLTPAAKDPAMTWTDVLGLSVLGGIGFTVALLVAELSFGLGTAHDDHAKVGVLVGSLLAALLGGAVLAVRNRAHSRQQPTAGQELVQDEQGHVGPLD